MMVTTVIANQLTDMQMQKYVQLIYDRTGIQIALQKKTLMSNRLRKLMKARDIACFDEYFDFLNRNRNNVQEWDPFLQEITTHETYLYRDQMQWDWFANEYLPTLVAASKRGERPRELRIWSAACSTGDEPYTIACNLADNLAVRDWEIQIVATDIGVGALQQARQADFSPRAMRRVPERIRERFFSQVEGDHWKPTSKLSNWIDFRKHNLMERLRLQPFDLIVVKNVLIYFDPESKKKVLDHIDPLLVPGGCLLTGPAEGVGTLINKYQRLKTWLHAKPNQVISGKRARN